MVVLSSSILISDDQVVGGLGQVGGFEPTHAFKQEAGGHHGLTSNKAGLAVGGAHALEEVCRGTGDGVHRVDHSLTGVASNLAEVRVLTQVHHRGGVDDAAVVTVSEGGDVALAHVLDHFEQVGLDIELGGFASFVGDAKGGVGVGELLLTTGQVVTALDFVGLATSFCFEQLVSEDAVTPAAVVIEQGEAADGLVEHVEVAGVQQQALGRDQRFTGNFESRGLGCVAVVGRAGVFPTFVLSQRLFILCFYTFTMRYADQRVYHHQN